MTTKDRELSVIKNKLESLTEEVDKKKKQLDLQRQELTAEKQKLNDKIDVLRSKFELNDVQMIESFKNQEQADEYMQRRLEDGREIALFKQKLEFQ